MLGDGGIIHERIHAKGGNDGTSLYTVSIIQSFLYKAKDGPAVA